MSLRHIMTFFMATQFVAADYAAASLGNGAESFNSVTGIVGQAPSQTAGLAKDSWYSLSKTVTVGVLEQEGTHDNYNVNGPSLLLVEGTEISILKFSDDKRFVLVGIDEDGFEINNPGIDPGQPTIAWIAVSDLDRAALQVVDVEAIDIEGLSQFAEGEPSEYVATELARRGGGSARRRGGRGRGGRGGMTYCLRDVRLHAARYTRAVPQGIPMASQAYPRYKAAGWRPVSYSSSNPIGTACFMGGGRSCGRGRKCGHAAIKISSNAWKGAGVRPTPFLSNSRGRVYSFHGCLVPPGR
jgi:hypothetical protein